MSRRFQNLLTQYTNIFSTTSYHQNCIYTQKGSSFLEWQICPFLGGIWRREDIWYCCWVVYTSAAYKRTKNYFWWIINYEEDFSSIVLAFGCCCHWKLPVIFCKPIFKQKLLFLAFCGLLDLKVCLDKHTGSFNMNCANLWKCKAILDDKLSL